MLRRQPGSRQRPPAAPHQASDRKHKTDLTSLLVQIVAGAIGGSAAGAAAKQYSLGTLGNAIAGAIGGGIVGQLIGAVAGTAVEGWVGNFAGGAVGGAFLMVLVGFIKDAPELPPPPHGMGPPPNLKTGLIPPVSCCVRKH